MRFIAITPFVTIVGATDLVCSEDIVRTADSQGFISSIYNCVYDQATSIGSQACLAAFIDANATDNEFPITGTCRDAYQSLVDVLYSSINFCSESTLEFGATPSQYAGCVSGFAYGLSFFQRDTGFIPFRMCSGAEVRYAALREPPVFLLIINSSWNLGGLVVALPHGNICNYCYDNSFSDFIDDFVASPATLLEACSALDGPTDVCLSSTVIMNARKAFMQCAGYDILMTGDMCTAEGVAAVESLIPAPYYTFSQCAYFPETPFCSATQAYLDAIEADTNSVDCLACYTELQSDLTALAADDSDDVCGRDVFSHDCLVYQTDALTAFELCSGYTLSTISATAAPSISTTAAPIVDDTTESTTTAAASSSVATATTKGASLFWISMIAIVLYMI